MKLLAGALLVLGMDGLLVALAFAEGTAWTKDVLQFAAGAQAVVAFLLLAWGAHEAANRRRDEEDEDNADPPAAG